jgi:hypothetical protein
MNLEQIRDLLILISGEKGHTFVYGPEDFVDLLHLAQLKHFKRKLGLPEQYSPGMPLPSQAFEINQRITEDMKQFKVIRGWHFNNPFHLTTEGTLAYPDEYYYPTSISYFYPIQDDYLERDIAILSDKEYQDTNTSVLKKSDKMFPICNCQSDFIRFSPKLKESINMSYLKLPAKPFWKAIDNDGFLEFDEANSVNLEWDDMNIIDILVIVLGDMGISLNSQNIVQYSENLKTKGI